MCSAVPDFAVTRKTSSPALGNVGWNAGFDVKMSVQLVESGDHPDRVATRLQLPSVDLEITRGPEKGRAVSARRPNHSPFDETSEKLAAARNDALVSARMRDRMKAIGNGMPK